MDQALLRFKKELPKIKSSKYVVMAVVPETLQRNLSCWKHYSEFKNTLAFKPRFIIEKGELKLIKNFMEDKNNFDNIKETINRLNKYDYFYNNFNKQLLSFPYIFNIIRKNKLKQFVVYSGVLFLEKAGINWRKFKRVPSKKIKESFDSDLRLLKDLYNNKTAYNLTLEILREFATTARKNNLIPIFMMMPQERDLRDILKNKKAYYQDFLDDASKFIPCVDLVTPLIALEDPISIFFQKKYSETYTVINGHYNPYGNQLVAQELNKIIHSLKK